VALPLFCQARSRVVDAGTPPARVLTISIAQTSGLVVNFLSTAAFIESSQRLVFIVAGTLKRNETSGVFSNLGDHELLDVVHEQPMRKAIVWRLK